MARMEEFQSRAKTEPQPNKQKKRQAPSTKQYHKISQDKFREKKGAEVLAEHDAELRKSLLCGFDSIEQVIKAKEYEDTKRNIVLPVSTRVAGFSTVHILNKILNVEHNRNRLPEMTYFAFYRVMLAMIERKVFDNRITASIDNRELWYLSEDFEPFKTVVTSLNVVTQQVGALIKSVSVFKYNNSNFVPLFPRGIYVGNRLIPTPENIYLTNLREVVTALADVRTDRRVRQNFRMKNPIPGAVFNENHILTNPDQIMPADYGAPQLVADLYSVKAWLEATAELKPVRAKWFTNVDMINTSHGNESMLVSNDSQDLRIVATRNDQGVISNRLEGDVTHFWIFSEIPMQMSFYGTYYLGGERASISRYLYPSYCVRTREASAVDTKRSYMEAVLAVET